METRLLIGGIASATAFACVYVLALAVSAAYRRRKTALAAQGQGDGSTASAFIGWRLRNGYAPLLPAASRLLKVKQVGDFAGEAVRVCSDRGLTATRESIVSVVLAAVAAVFLVVAVLTRSVAGAAAVAVCVVVVAAVIMGGMRDKRKESVREEVPNALESMSACLGTGFTLLQTFQQVGQEVPGRLGSLFSRGAHILETGGSAEQALDELRQGAMVSELAFVAVALDVQHQNGGSMKQVLDAASDSVKSELALRRSLRVQTAQAKLSARVVVVMPFVLMAAFSLISPDFLTPFFSSAAGYGLLVLAIGMQVVGVLLVRRALSVDGVS